MIDISSAEVEVLLKPLWQSKELVISKVVITSPKIYLEVAKNGKTSWDFSLPAPLQKHTKQTNPVFDFLLPSAMANEPDLVSQKNTFIDQIIQTLLNFKANSVVIENGSVNYIDYANAKDFSIDINVLKASISGLYNPVSLSWDIDYQNINIAGDGGFSSINSIFDNTKPLSANANINAFGTKNKITALIFDLTTSPKIDFELSSSSPSGNFNLPAIGLNASGKFDTKIIDINIKKLSYADNIISGTSNIDLSKEVPHIKADLASDLIDLQSIMPPKPKAKNGFSFGLSTAHASELVPNKVIDYSLLNLINGELQTSIKTLVINPNTSLKNLQLNTSLNKGKLNINNLDFDFGQGLVAIKAMAEAKEQRVSLNLNGKNLLLQDILNAAEVEKNKHFSLASGGNTELQINLSGQGKTYRELVAGLTGQSIAIVDKSKIESKDLEVLSSNIITQIAEVLKVDLASHKNINLNCAVIRGDFNNGIIKFPQGVAIDSNELNIVSSGNLNLKNDKIDLSLNAYKKSLSDVGIVQALSNLIQIKGSIQSPSLTVDTKGAIKTVAGALLGGPIGVGAQMILDKDTAPCYTALQGTSYKNKYSKPKGATSSAQGVYKGATKVVDTGVGALQNTSTKTIKQTGKEIEKKVRDIRDQLKIMFK